MINLDAIGIRTKISAEILRDIDYYCETTYDDGPRKHLGASLIGHPCSRHLWFSFRWAKHMKHDGRQQRLFNRGHREEARFNEWLRGTGFTVWDTEPEVLHWHPESDSYFIAPQFDSGDGLAEDVTRLPTHVEIAKSRGVELKNKQWRFSACEGHFGGSCDGKGLLPQKYEYPNVILFEFKTNSTGPKFNELLKSGCATVKPQHFDQQSVYGYLGNHEYSLYLNICKNDDNIHSELIKLDLKRGEQLVKKAEIIILSQVPPPKLSLSKTSFECKFCDHMNICHEGSPLDINCRSCKFAQPIANKEWWCQRHNGKIPEDFIPKGCGDWTDIRT